MVFICDNFSNSLHKDVDSQKIWDHLETMYNLEALDESELLPFPNSEKEFSLPEIDFGSLVIKKDEWSSNSDSPKLLRKEDKMSMKNIKDNLFHRDNKEGKDNNKQPTGKREVKKESEKSNKAVKGRNSLSTAKEEKSKSKEESAKPVKRPTRGSLKPSDDSGSNGKSSPINVSNVKRRRI
ncbi:MRG/MORF4L-binding protein isoform X2 [Cylas formicarius]|nr:MRG/MORF4L-binding protein isoform X2 [Cylas formicarius]XP_060528525.1 MRG/MORF4L-binding protein isoform X2 [Cylas formicarius]